ncbi:hypothetical protein E4U14_008052 [Claviceps sp. LM454 group G7]|nr:hypothetical protein E4U14_008052 [Claviceps sp. LM454 group G7]
MKLEVIANLQSRRQRDNDIHEAAIEKLPARFGTKVSDSGGAPFSVRFDRNVITEIVRFFVIDVDRWSRQFLHQERLRVFVILVKTLSRKTPVFDADVVESYKTARIEQSSPIFSGETECY